MHGRIGTPSYNPGRIGNPSYNSASLRLHALVVEGVELGTGLLGRLLDAGEELLFVLVDLAVGEKHVLQPARLIGVDLAVGQDVFLDGFEEQSLEAGTHLF